LLSPADAELDDDELRKALRARLGEAAMMAGILGGHVMLLFSVAFLRTKSQVIFQAWFEFVPALALLGTVGFTLAVRPLTRAILAALQAGPNGDAVVLRRGLAQAESLPTLLAYLNFVVWWGSARGTARRWRPRWSGCGCGPGRPRPPSRSR
jgi:hypothetical protein